MRKTFIYIKLSVKALLKRPGVSTISNIIQHSRSWHRYNSPSVNSVSERMPWLSFSAIEHIKNIITADMTLFEFGSGGSTLFWASRVKHVISIEHDKLWHEKMKNEISNAGITNVDYYLIEAVNNPKLLRKDFLNPADYSSGDELYSGKDFEQYVKKIDELPDQSLDVIVIDGRARPSCILHSIPKLKPKGHLIIDNSDREYYLKPFQFGAKNWKQWDHYGPAPFTYGFTQTSILQKI